MDNNKLGGELPTEAEFDEVLAKLDDMGLRGILILGRACPDCGAAHRYAVGTDVEGEDIPEVLRYMAKLCEGKPVVNRERERSPH